jgi:bacteriorhodopsin
MNNNQESGKDKDKSKEPNKKDDENKYKKSESAFYLNHVWMGITVIITIITSLILKIPLQKYIILMEAFISAVSTYIYYLLWKKIQINKFNNEAIDWKGITILRYNGWFFTTPIMLIAFLFFLSSTTNITFSPIIPMAIVILDWIMLYLGYLGEIGNISRNTALIAGFIPLFIIFWIIYQTFFKNQFIFRNLVFFRNQTFFKINNIIFILFILFWTLYGIGYTFELEPRNYLMNILDLLSKSFIGLIFAFYFLWKQNKIRS